MTAERPPLPTAAQFAAWGIDPAWSRLIDVRDRDGRPHSWHVLDTGTPAPVTVVCVHGNPTWSVYWRSVLRRLGADHRVVAVDQLGMGYSERGGRRRFAQRVDDLEDVLAALDVRGPVVVVAHDWGGPISLGWALRHVDDVIAIALCNTGVAVPAGRRAPALIRLAATGPLTDLVCRRTRTFVDGTLALSWRRIAADARPAYRAPYRRARDRAAIAEFVADVPFDDTHPSAAAIATVAEGVRQLECPVLLAWGAADPVFDDDFAADLAERMPHAVQHRFGRAGHLVVEEEDVAGLLATWLASLEPVRTAHGDRPVGGVSGEHGEAHGVRLASGDASPDADTLDRAVRTGGDGGERWDGPAECAGDAASADGGVAGTAGAGGSVSDVPVERAGDAASAEPGDSHGVRPTSGGVSRRVSDAAAERTGGGASVERGDWDGVSRRVWDALAERAEDGAPAFVDGRTGAVTSFGELHGRVETVAAGLAAAGVRAGDRVALLVEPGIDLLAVAYGCWRAGAVTVIADRGLGLRGLGRAVRSARVQSVIGAPAALAAARALRWAPRATRIPVESLVRERATHASVPPVPPADAPAAVLFTSGATGPAKGVRYSHAQIAAQVEALRALYGIGPGDRLVAAFAPFALYGPALGITSTIPDVDVTKPGDLTAAAFRDAVAATDATVAFASPAALANVVRTSDAGAPGIDSLRLVLSAGAPVPVATLRGVAALCPQATLHTPYGMTECLPVADISLAEIDDATTGGAGGVCVGHPVPGVDVMIAPIGLPDGLARHVRPEETGEILVRAPWCSSGYDVLWGTERNARPRDRNGVTWHRTGDVGHLDATGRLWVEGRSAHLIHTVDGTLTPVPIEVAVEAALGITQSAAVGVGPVGCQQLVVVIADRTAAEGVAPADVAATVRRAIPDPVAAVLRVHALPVDIRHNTKIDRIAVARWADGVLRGGRARASRGVR